MTPLERAMRVPHVCVIGCQLSATDHWPKETKTMLSRDERLMSAIERLTVAVERVAAAYERAFPPPPAWTYIPYNNPPLQTYPTTPTTPTIVPVYPAYPTTTPFPEVTNVIGTVADKTEVSSYASAQADGLGDDSGTRGD